MDTTRLESLLNGVQLRSLKELDLSYNEGIEESAWALLRSSVLIHSSKTMQSINVA